jgi:uncharacterized protein YggL (DUF469 family)
LFHPIDFTATGDIFNNHICKIYCGQLQTTEGIMKKRLRKKLFLGEFKELGFDLKAEVKLPSEAELDAFWQKFVAKIEELELHCSGAFGEATLDLFVLVGKPGTEEVERRGKFLAWLQEQPEVSNVVAGELIDAFYDDCCCGSSCAPACKCGCHEEKS